MPCGRIKHPRKDDILRGLEEIRIEIERGSFTWSVALEDVHMNIEAALTAKIGMAGKSSIRGALETIKWPQTYVYTYETK